MKLFVSSLLDHSSNKIHVFYGTGCNGKSLLMSLFSEIFDCYSFKIDETYLINKLNDNHIHLLSKENNKISFIDGIDYTMKVDNRNINLITSNDTIVIKDKYSSKYYETKIKTNLIVLTNDLSPFVNSNDANITKKLKIIEFPNSFIHNADTQLYYKLNSDEYKNAFIHLLFNVYYPLYKSEGLNF
jgi:phage/plasmid-associated DNA primase